MAVTKVPRPSTGSSNIKFIDGIAFPGLGSGGFSENDLLIIGDEQDNLELIGGDGNDEIKGEAGNDVLREGLGNGSVWLMPVAFTSTRTSNAFGPSKLNRFDGQGLLRLERYRGANVHLYVSPSLVDPAGSAADRAFNLDCLPQPAGAAVAGRADLAALRPALGVAAGLQPGLARAGGVSSSRCAEPGAPMKITVSTLVDAPLHEVWRGYTTPEDIKAWNAASPDWHTTAATVDLRPGGSFSSRMEARDGSFGFDFAGQYIRVVPHQLIEYEFGGSVGVVEFTPGPGGVIFFHH